MSVRFLLFADGDSSFYVKREGEKPTRHFSDFLEALAFVYEAKGENDAQLVVYDSMGRIAFKDMSVGTESEFLLPASHAFLDHHFERKRVLSSQLTRRAQGAQNQGVSESRAPHLTEGTIFSPP